MKIISMLTFGEAVRFLRLRQDLTLRELAEMTNVKEPMLSLLENNKRLPSIETVRSLADALLVPRSTLLTLLSD